MSTLKLSLTLSRLAPVRVMRAGVFFISTPYVQRCIGVLCACAVLMWTPGARADSPTLTVGAGHTVPAATLSNEGPVSILRVRQDVYMLTAEGSNIAVETGSQGTVVVDSGPPTMAMQILDAVRRVSSSPIRYVINTSADGDRVGGNAVLANAGSAFSPGPLGAVAPIIASQNALFRMIAEPEKHFPTAALPSEIFTRPQRSMFVNGQGIAVILEPDAHTNGDSLVWFRRSDVVVTGHVFDINSFPEIDLSHGGSIDGELRALNQLLNRLTIAVTPVIHGAGGTLVIPGQGPLCDQLDVLNYRDMVTIIRDRVAALLRERRSLKYVEASRPARGYVAVYGGAQAARRFIEEVYASLSHDNHLPGARGKSGANPNGRG